MNHRSYWLELRSPHDFRPKPFPGPDISIRRATESDADICRDLWAEVGRGFWTEREDWPRGQWQVQLGTPTVPFWIAKMRSQNMGFFELTSDGQEVKIEGFGLLPDWRSRGLGGGLLSAATQQAFDLGARRIWSHTATDDHPQALPNYLNRGYSIYREAALKNPLTDDCRHPRRP